MADSHTIYMKYYIFVVSLLLLIGFTVATNQTTSVEPEPGLIKADSPIYNWKLAFDNIRLSLGLADPGELAHQRTSEAVTAYERGNSQAAESALDNLNEILESTDQTHSDQLNQASQLLTGVNASTPSEAEHGVETALRALEQGQNQADTANPEPDPEPEAGEPNTTSRDWIPSVPRPW
ncbi:hypothetical protein OB919_21485 [Halobacteria archaeon AArc-curdl1]|uniref:DUF5667 domain-containing protein n=1 Tax=Natronosalvus hydrolyticus TaxID=2979988 RepID=A0AAP2ZCK2_9EURY|nr:hypothetical protein [Halobacteria archaeon AArc-curdl1]